MRTGLVYPILRGSHFTCRPKDSGLRTKPSIPSSLLPVHQNQTVQILAQISQQIASIGTQTRISFNTTFQPSVSDRRVNVCWLMNPVFSLCAALLVTLVQKWVRSYMGAFQRSSNPLKTARVRQFLFEGVDFLPLVAEAIPGPQLDDNCNWKVMQALPGPGVKHKIDYYRFVNFLFMTRSFSQG